ncbi:MAG TPA: T9SS type A sorting domain-containing protein [Candidatus Kapabacteria bacterium]|nr:T9SS type A sorting domain-containing protein [Candidatus Kapabacteria bacterium]
MLKYVKFLPILLFTLFFAQNAKSQNDTTFDTQIIFNGEMRILSVHVPKLTNGAEKYKLFIWLHGLGDNSTNFLNVMVSSGQLSFLENTIIAAPDGGNDQASDFYSPEGDEVFIKISEDWVKSNYEVDTNYIYLGGFSLGGRSALKYGLDNPTEFRGLLLNTPALQGLKDVRGLLGMQFKYENANKIPIAITNGGDDIVYINIDDSLFKYLVENNCKVIKNTINGMGHQIPGATILKPCFEFLDNPMKNELDAEMNAIIYPNEYSRIYSQSITPIIRVRNTGATPITSIHFTYIINDVSKSYSLQVGSTPLESFHYLDIELPLNEVPEGISEIVVQIDSINSIAVNNQLSRKSLSNLFLVNLNSIPLPYKFGFEENDQTFSKWQTVGSGNLFTWSLDSSKTEGEYSLTMFNTPYFFDNMGIAENMFSPMLDLTTVNHPILTFDVAFNYLHFTPPSASQEISLSDTLRVYLGSPDLPNIYFKIYEKAGADLATASEPILNPQSLNGCIFTPKANEWRKETIDLINYRDLQNAVLRFEYTSGLGGTIYIDNLIFDDITDVNESALVDNSMIEIYPNPAKNYVNIALPDNSKSIEIFTVEGLRLFSSDITTNSGMLKLDIGQYNPGIYIIKINTGEKIVNGRFVISR